MMQSQPQFRCKPVDQRAFLTFVTCFYVAWTVRALGPVPHYILSLNLSPLKLALFSLVLKFSLWVVPVFLYLKFIDKMNPWEYLGLKAGWCKGVLWGLIIGLVQISFYAGLNYFLKGKPPTLNLGIGSWLNGIILVGFIEETLFRGFILQKLTDWIGFWRANSLTSILFMLIHFPGWVEAKSFTGLVMPIAVLILGFLFGLAKKYTKSLWASIIFHSINNFVAMAISPFR